MSPCIAISPIGEKLWGGLNFILNSVTWCECNCVGLHRCSADLGWVNLSAYKFVVSG